MKPTTIFLALILVSIQSFAQWTTAEEFKNGYYIIGADDISDKSYSHVPLIDSVMLLATQKELEKRRTIFYKGIDSLKKYQIEPPKSPYYFPDISDSLKNMKINQKTYRFKIDSISKIDNSIYT